MLHKHVLIYVTLLQLMLWYRCALLWSTYACHLSGGEDARQQEHLYRNGEDKDERER